MLKQSHSFILMIPSCVIIHISFNESTILVLLMAFLFLQVVFNKDIRMCYSSFVRVFLFCCLETCLTSHINLSDISRCFLEIPLCDSIIIKESKN